MLSEDWNVKQSTVGMSLSVCVFDSSGLAWDRCAAWDRTIPVFTRPAFYYCLIPSQSHPTLVNRQKRTTINHRVR